MKWRGVFSATTTPFNEDLSVDYRALREHVQWQIANGVRGIVPLGSLGEASTLIEEEKRRIIETCVDAAAESSVPVVAGIAGLRTTEAVDLARAAHAAGCSGLMVLPPYVYRGDTRETETHFDTVIRATPLPCMLYNNPVAYGTDVLPKRIAVLAERHANLEAVKESSTDVRRVTEIHRLLGDRLAIFCGVDDAIAESLYAGAVGWIAGLVNAFPAESVRLFNLVTGDDDVAIDAEAARELYEWFLPLLRLDTVPKFIQLIKLVQEEVGRGSARVRPPRLELEGKELASYRELIRVCIQGRPGALAET